ncbi:endonuclease/exonuclease/phosphatase family protein [Nocardia uniformis]|uniref:Endonuclease/exonuclease/phosphatase family protein n=1 Tax=Nocardia uniformis TaxID=53432 RepID=A0A849C2I1_9NOCA|nr:endonuclease/exonuclease/phosphatase family protein [Nocardia uniformis]NNH71938.1 endonuclease/exonuclease/phosphatase family protein [Nocardia uniformis]
MITVATWNVLHRVHAENWYEDVAQRWPDEELRIKAVTARVASRSEQIIALQEVSGDQLASLRRALPGRTIHAFRYPRLPRPRRIETILSDRGEYLALLVDGPSREVVAESFANDPGKGLLAVSAFGATFIATHVTGDRRRASQFARLAQLSTDPGGTILLGDFNRDRERIAAALGPSFTVAPFESEAVPTRPRTSGAKSRFIDHVVGRAATITDASVDNVDGLSDHNLVHATVVTIGVGFGFGFGG